MYLTIRYGYYFTKGVKDVYFKIRKRIIVFTRI